MQRTAAGAVVLQEEPSLYQSPLSHQSVSSFGSPSPRPAAPTPTQVTPNTPAMGQQPPDSRNALLTSIAKGQFHLRKMSHSFEPKGDCLIHTYAFMLWTANGSFVLIEPWVSMTWSFVPVAGPAQQPS